MLRFWGTMGGKVVRFLLDVVTASCYEDWTLLTDDPDF
jgi:hypothetical protein